MTGAGRYHAGTVDGGLVGRAAGSFANWGLLALASLHAEVKGETNWWEDSRGPDRLGPGRPPTTRINRLVVQKNAPEGFMSLPQPDDGLPVSWQQHASCRNTESDVFFPTSFNRSTLAAARRYCDICPVTDTCLEYAITIGGGEGIWGGATPPQRSLAKLNTRLALIR